MARPICPVGNPGVPYSPPSKCAALARSKVIAQIKHEDAVNGQSSAGEAIAYEEQAMVALTQAKKGRDVADIREKQKAVDEAKGYTNSLIGVRVSNVAAEWQGKSANVITDDVSVTSYNLEYAQAAYSVPEIPTGTLIFSLGNAFMDNGRKEGVETKVNSTGVATGVVIAEKTFTWRPARSVEVQAKLGFDFGRGPNNNSGRPPYYIGGKSAEDVTFFDVNDINLALKFGGDKDSVTVAGGWIGHDPYDTFGLFTKARGSTKFGDTRFSKLQGSYSGGSLAGEARLGDVRLVGKAIVGKEVTEFNPFEAKYDTAKMNDRSKEDAISAVTLAGLEWRSQWDGISRGRFNNEFKGQTKNIPPDDVYSISVHGEATIRERNGYGIVAVAQIPLGVVEESDDPKVVPKHASDVIYFSGRLYTLSAYNAAASTDPKTGEPGAPVWDDTFNHGFHAAWKHKGLLGSKWNTVISASWAFNTKTLQVAHQGTGFDTEGNPIPATSEHTDNGEYRQLHMDFKRPIQIGKKDAEWTLSGGVVDRILNVDDSPSYSQISPFASATFVFGF